MMGNDSSLLYKRLVLSINSTNENAVATPSATCGVCIYAIMKYVCNNTQTVAGKRYFMTTYLSWWFQDLFQGLSLP